MMRRTTAVAVAAAALLLLATPARAEDEKDRRIEELERAVQELRGELKALRGEEDPLAPLDELGGGAALREQIDVLEARMNETALPRNPFSWGGYAEIHANFGEGGEKDVFDYHRFVLFIGYDFTDWISFSSELEIEHTAVGGDWGGELIFEQFMLDFEFSEAFNARIGRFLTPIGITNQRHEPPSFPGVERPLFDQVIIPTTWSADGVGLFGAPLPFLSYEVYLVAGLDGTGFSPTSGIRGGRIKERPSLNDLAVTGRVDFFPLATTAVSHGQHLRFGVSGWFGGLDNGNNGDDPDLDASMSILSADFEYTIGPFDLRGAAAWIDVDGADEIGGNVAEAIFGWYLEAAFHFFPEAWKSGRLSESDLVVFVRYEDLDTQHEMPAGVTADPRGDRRAITAGIAFYILPNLVVKLDYTTQESEADEDPADMVNFGVGWQF